jgi:hypothetical protein
MRAVCALVAFAMIFDLPMTASVEAQTVAPTVDKSAANTPLAAQSGLIADCAETAYMPSPLPERPTLRRATYASKPGVPHRHRARPKKRTHRVVHAKKASHIRKATHAKRKVLHRRPAAHRPAAKRPILHRVTYASPLCAKRSTVLNDMLGLPDYDITQPAIAGDAVPGTTSLPAFIDVPPVIGTGSGPITGGGTGPGPITFPGGPIYPVGPGPIVVEPTPPVGPPVVTPPVTPPSSVPEPASWAMMIMGMMLVGSSLRRMPRRKAA